MYYLRTEMTNVQDNIVEHVLECISLLDTYTAKYQKIGEQEHINRGSVLDMLEEISILLCKLLATMITAPITGRMFIPLPSSKFNTDDVHSSLQKQMSQI